MIAAACEFLNELERAQKSGKELPVPFVMRRIRDLLNNSYDSQPQPTKDIASSHSYDIHHGSYNTQPTKEDKMPPVHYRHKQKNQKLPTQKTDVLCHFLTSIRAMEAVKYPIYVDIKCLNTNRGYIIKEFSARCLGAPTAWITIKSPAGVIPIQKDNDHLVTSVHGIHWDVGFIDVQQLCMYTNKLFRNNCRPVFVKGIQKVDILANALKIKKELIESLDEFPKLRSLRELYDPPACPYHRQLDKMMSCTLKHTFVLMAYHADGDWS